MATQKEYVDAAEQRIYDTMRACGVSVDQGLVCTAILVELNSMYETGFDRGYEKMKDIVLQHLDLDS